MRTVIPKRTQPQVKQSGAAISREGVTFSWFSRNYLSAVMAKRPAQILALLGFLAVLGALFLVFAAGTESTSLPLSGGNLNGTVYNTTNKTVSLATQPLSIKLGVYAAPFPLNNDVTPLDAYSTLVGKPPKIVMWYTNWTFPILNSTFAVDAVTQRNAEPMITWLPCASGHCAVGDTTYAPKVVAAGTYDALITKSADQVKAWGKPLYIRLAHEMNGNWNIWGNVTGNTPADYIAMWRHVITIFRTEGATNAQFVWSPNINPTGTLPFDSYYPGDSYVDWVALDGYNKGTDCAQWRTIGPLFKSSYDDISSLSSKPLMIAETSSAEGPGGSKPDWITQSFLTDLPTDFPKIKAVIWFDRDNSSQGGCEKDWRVNSSPASLSAWQNVVASPPYWP